MLKSHTRLASRIEWVQIQTFSSSWPYYYYNAFIYLVLPPHFHVFSLLFSMKVLLWIQLLRNKGGVALLSLCLLILTRGPFTVKRHKESSLRATTSPSTQLSPELQNRYGTEAWKLIPSRCLKSEQDQKVDTEITKHLIRSWWNQGPRVGSEISETQRPCLFRGTSKAPINAQERWEGNHCRDPTFLQSPTGDSPEMLHSVLRRTQGQVWWADVWLLFALLLCTVCACKMQPFLKLSQRGQTN